MKIKIGHNGAKVHQAEMITGELVTACGTTHIDMYCSAWDDEEVDCGRCLRALTMSENVDPTATLRWSI